LDEAIKPIAKVSFIRTFNPLTKNNGRTATSSKSPQASSGNRANSLRVLR